MSEIAREEPEGAALNQMRRAIVDVLREQARSYTRKAAIASTDWRISAGPL
ncbi:hypothetical protein J3D60_002706 [Pseudomonas sp. S3E17]|nr:hypothetical protein [Pseudomonas sp. S3E17]